MQTGDIAGFRPIPPGEFRVQGNLFQVAVLHDQVAMLRYLLDYVRVPECDSYFWDVMLREGAWHYAISTGKLWAADLLVPDRGVRRKLVRDSTAMRDTLFEAVRSRSMDVVRYVTEDIGVSWTELQPTRFASQPMFVSMLFRTVCQSGTVDMLHYVVAKINKLYNCNCIWILPWKFMIGVPTLTEALIDACSVAYQNEPVVLELLANVYFEEEVLRCALRESVLFCSDEPTPVARTVIKYLGVRHNHDLPAGIARFRNWSLRKRMIFWRRSTVLASKTSRVNFSV